MPREKLDVRRGLIIRTVLEVLRDSGDFVPRPEIFRRVAERIDLTSDEAALSGKYESPRYTDIIDFKSGNASRLGWIEKHGGAGWRITQTGLTILDSIHPEEDLNRKLTFSYRHLRETKQPAAWLVRGSNVAGLWRIDSFVSLPTAQLRIGIEPGTNKEALRKFIDEDYESTATYNQKQEMVEDIHAFLSRMRPGDTVVTLSVDQLYLGEITGPAEQVKSPTGSKLRRSVQWQETGFD